MTPQPVTAIAVRRLAFFLRKAEVEARSIGNHPFGLAFIVYAVIVISSGHYLWLQRAREWNYRTTRVLQHNHRIAVGDIRRPASLASSFGFSVHATSPLQGAYVSAPSVASDTPIPSTALAEAPDMEWPKDHQLIAIQSPASAALLPLLDAGTILTVRTKDSNGAKMRAIRVPVHVILCGAPQPAGSSCYPVIEVTSDQGGWVLQNLATLQLSLDSK